jgi:hypothetical protein
MSKKSKSMFRVLSLNEFKTNMCAYMRRLSAGEEHYFIRRYNKNVALVMSLSLNEIESEANKAQASLRRHFATIKRHEEERRLCRARLLSWPGARRRDS